MSWFVQFTKRYTETYAVKGTDSRDFRLLVFFMNQFSRSPWVYHYGCFKFFENLRRYSQIKVHHLCRGTGGKWKKSSIIKVLVILFGHLWEVELTYRYIFAFKFTLRSHQPDIVPIICHRCRWYQWCTLTCEYLREFSKKFKTVLLGDSWAGKKLSHEKNQKQKISWHCPFKELITKAAVLSYCVYCTRAILNHCTVIE